MNDRDQLRKLGEANPKPADPLAGWAIKTGGGMLTAESVALEAQVSIDKDGSLCIEGYPCEWPVVPVSDMAALIALWRESNL